MAKTTFVNTQLRARVGVRTRLHELLEASIKRTKEACDDEQTEPLALRALMQATAQCFEMWASVGMLPTRPKMQTSKGLSLDVQEAHVLGDVRAIASHSNRER